MRATGTNTYPQAGRLLFSLPTHSGFYSLNKRVLPFSALCLASCGLREPGLSGGSQELTGLWTGNCSEHPLQRPLLLPLGTGGARGAGGWAGPERRT